MEHVTGASFPNTLVFFLNFLDHCIIISLNIINLDGFSERIRFYCVIWLSYACLPGLQRCGKSCRLRWTNYLRPDLKHGQFSEAEEQTIVTLHSVLGNRYSNHFNSFIRSKVGIFPCFFPQNAKFLSRGLHTLTLQNSDEKILHYSLSENISSV